MEVSNNFTLGALWVEVEEGRKGLNSDGKNKKIIKKKKCWDLCGDASHQLFWSFYDSKGKMER